MKRLSDMTLEEKIGQLVMYGKYGEAQQKALAEGRIGSFLNNRGEETQMRQNLALDSPTGIPLIMGDDVIHGFRTIFPIPLALSCSFDLGLIEETCALSAREAAMEGINMIFAPMVDISRDPRWGRVAEGAGEDPYLGSEVARARVRGYQRNDWEDMPKTAACAKHYVAYGAPQGGRDYDGADISERSLREIYLPPFDAAVKAGVMSVMSSFNDLNGIPVSGNERAIREILRGELGFGGVVVSDWESVEELVNHSIASDGREAARLGFKAGVDIDMNSGVYERYLKELVREGKLTVEEIDQAAGRVLKLKERLGVFGKKRFVMEDARRLSLENLAAKELALKAARESIVLLKNRDLLPLRKGTKLAVIGQLADDRPDMLGCWAGQVEAQESVTVLEGLENLGEEFRYERGCEINSDIEGGIDRAREIASKAQVVLMVLGETSSMSGENRSRADITIPAVQRKLLRSVMEINENVVLVVVSGRPLVLSWEEANVPAILQLWQPGHQAGNALAEILYGIHNPSGKLTLTFPAAVGQIPVYYNRKNTGRPLFKKYIDIQDEPLFPFGWGLSYTDFDYEDLALSSDSPKMGEELKVSARVTNRGDHDGSETVMLFVRDVTASVTRPVMELKGFEKLFLKAGQSKNVQFDITGEMLSFLDENLKPALEKGRFEVFLGRNSVEHLKGYFELI